MRAAPPFRVGPCADPHRRREALGRLPSPVSRFLHEDGGGRNPHWQVESEWWTLRAVLACLPIPETGAIQVEKGERPDFVIGIEGHPGIGVEVTEVVSRAVAEVRGRDIHDGEMVDMTPYADRGDYPKRAKAKRSLFDRDAKAARDLSHTPENEPERRAARLVDKAIGRKAGKPGQFETAPAGAVRVLALHLNTGLPFLDRMELTRRVSRDRVDAFDRVLLHGAGRCERLEAP